MINSTVLEAALEFAELWTESSGGFGLEAFRKAFNLPEIDHRLAVNFVHSLSPARGRPRSPSNIEIRPNWMKKLILKFSRHHHLKRTSLLTIRIVIRMTTSLWQSRPLT